MIKVSCKNCGHTIEVNLIPVAQICRCPKCKECITVTSKERFEATNEHPEVKPFEKKEVIRPLVSEDSNKDNSKDNSIRKEPTREYGNITQNTTNPKTTRVRDKVITSITFSVMLIYFISCYVPVFNRARMLTWRIISASNLKGLETCFMLYCDYHDDKLPTANKWCDLLSIDGVPQKIFYYPSSKNKEDWGYALNKNLEGLKRRELTRNTVMLFEANIGKNAVGGPEAIDTERHKGKGCNILFTDGRVEFIETKKLSELKWEPRKDKTTPVEKDTANIQQDDKSVSFGKNVLGLVLGLLILVYLVTSFCLAILLRMATKWISKKTIPYGKAYVSALMFGFIIPVGSFLMMFPKVSFESFTAISIILCIISFFFTSFIISMRIKKVSFGKACLISLVMYGIVISINIVALIIAFPVSRAMG